MPEDYEYQRTTYITCPYCGEWISDSAELADMKGETEWECYKCEKTYIIEEPEMEIYFTTRPILK